MLMITRQVYFDNSATSFPKPTAVSSAVSTAITKYGGNPGRSGHVMSTTAANIVYKNRVKLAHFFNCDETNIVFTQNCTHSLNTALKGILRYKDHVLTSSYEHNSVLRPLFFLNKYYGIVYDIVDVHNLSDNEIVLAFERKIKRDTRLLVITHASNVIGRIMPIALLGDMCHRHGILLVVDAAQTAGVLPIDMKQLQIDILCCAGHKSLFGVGGGVLLLADELPLFPMLHGGTGTNSLELSMPEMYPERMEAGTLNVPTICSIGAGVDFINNSGIDKIHAFEKSLCKLFYDTLKDNKKVTLYSLPNHLYAPLVAFSLENQDCQEVCQKLSDNGFYLRSGFMCAAKIHECLGTTQNGVIRFSPSIFNHKSEVTSLCHLIENMI